MSVGVRVSTAGAGSPGAGGRPADDRSALLPEPSTASVQSSGQQPPRDRRRTAPRPSAPPLRHHRRPPEDSTATARTPVPLQSPAALGLSPAHAAPLQRRAAAPPSAPPRQPRA